MVFNTAQTKNPVCVCVRVYDFRIYINKRLFRAY